MIDNSKPPYIINKIGRNVNVNKNIINQTATIPIITKDTVYCIKKKRSKK